ncbi:hypothetical protein GCM10023187_26710 [Nibrella viscosa]|uniref:Uncharacterized protein n=1 Tax=Nibrella viscosa TaxID=1084524 RepID=A0ABP8KI37_9BACT
MAGPEAWGYDVFLSSRPATDYARQKPEQAVIDQLKKSGFNWSRSGGCWQRKITADAKWNATQITGVAFN